MERLSQLRKKLTRLGSIPGEDGMMSTLVWESAPAFKENPELMWATQSGYVPQQPKGGDPLVFFLRKSGSRSNAFGIGVTLGRTRNNDLTIDDPSVSRFHAYFQRDEQSGIWHVVDAKSHNGTFCNGSRIPPGRPAPLSDELSLQVGSVLLHYFSPDAFRDYVRKLPAPKG